MRAFRFSLRYSPVYNCNHKKGKCWEKLGNGSMVGEEVKILEKPRRNRKVDRPDLVTCLLQELLQHLRLMMVLADTVRRRRRKRGREMT